MSIINRYAIICMIQKVLTNRIEWNPWCASWTGTWLIFFKSALTRAFAWKVWARETKWRYVRTHIMGTIRNLHFSTFFVITGRRVLWTLHISHLSLSVTRVKFDVYLGVWFIGFLALGKKEGEKISLPNYFLDKVTVIYNKYKIYFCFSIKAQIF